MIFDIAFTMIENVNNDIQISVAQGCSPGQRIITETMEEKPKDKNGQDLFTVHPTKPWLINSSDNYILMLGELKVWFRWKDGDPFSKENVDDYIAFQETLRPNFRSDVDLVVGDDYVQGTYNHVPTTTTDFIEATYDSWRPYTSEGGVEIMSADTVFVCPMQYEVGWTFKTADLMHGESMTITKEGSTRCYLLTGQDVSAGETSIPKYKLIELQSSSVTITNNSGTFCKIAKIFR